MLAARRRVVLALAFLLALSPPVLAGLLAQDTTGDPDMAARAEEALADIDAVVQEALEDFGIPGLAVAVVASDRVVLARGYGVRDVDDPEPVTPDTLFAIGSTSKAFTAFVLGTLVDEGRLDWDTPVSEYLPDFRLQDPHATRRLKVRDLLIHSSGLPRHDLAWYNAAGTREELYGRLRHLEPTRDLGEEFQYQNLMFMTAGYLAERITGRPWEELVRERIFAPLGMTRSNFSVTVSAADPDHAEPHALEDRQARKIPFRNIDAIGPAGSINSAVAEMTAWMRMQLAGGEIDGRRLIEETTLREMHTPHMAIAAYPDEQRTLTMGYGMGWSVEAHRGHFLVQHGGGIDGFISWVALLPLDDLGVVVYTNASGSNPLPAAVARTIIDRVLGLEDGGYLARAHERMLEAEKAAQEAEDKAGARRKSGTSPSHPLQAYAGTYRHPGYGDAEIGLADGALQLTFHDMTAPLEHWHYDVFVGGSGGEEGLEDVKVQFRLDLEGEIAQLVVPFEPQAGPIVFERQPDARLSEPGYLSRFEGAYELRERRVTVSVQGDRLRLSIPGQPALDLVPVREREFALDGMEGYLVEFLVDDSGAVTAARFVRPDGIFEAVRVRERP